jgi:rubrerythrin
MALDWQEELATGIDIIDEQHKGIKDHVLKKTLPLESLRILDICRDIELLNEQIYRYFAVLFAENRELATLWEKTANEEANHAQQFEFAIRIKNELLESVAIDAWTVATAFKFVRTLLESVKKSPPSVIDALQLSVKLEARLANLHMECIAGFLEESHRMLFRAMMENDDRHRESLMAAQIKYSSPRTDLKSAASPSPAT